MAGTDAGGGRIEDPTGSAERSRRTRERELMGSVDVPAGFPAAVGMPKTECRRRTLECREDAEKARRHVMRISRTTRSVSGTSGLGKVVGGGGRFNRGFRRVREGSMSCRTGGSDVMEDIYKKGRLCVRLKYPDTKVRTLGCSRSRRT